MTAFGAQCPHCDTFFKVYPDQLRLHNGFANCGACGRTFDVQAVLVHLPQHSTTFIEQTQSVVDGLPVLNAVANVLSNAQIIEQMREQQRLAALTTQTPQSQPTSPAHTATTLTPPSPTQATGSTPLVANFAQFTAPTQSPAPAAERETPASTQISTEPSSDNADVEQKATNSDEPPSKASQITGQNLPVLDFDSPVQPKTDTDTHTKLALVHPNSPSEKAIKALNKRPSVLLPLLLWLFFGVVLILIALTSLLLWRPEWLQLMSQYVIGRAPYLEAVKNQLAPIVHSALNAIKALK